MQPSVQSQLTITMLWQFYFNPFLSGVTLKINMKMDYKVNLIITHFMMTRDDPKYQSCSLLNIVKKRGGGQSYVKKAAEFVMA